MRKQSLIEGTLILGFAGVIARFLGLFFRWPLIMLIGDEGIGYYQMSYPLYMFFISIAAGVPVAISKMVSERRAVLDNEGVIKVLRKALLLMVTIGAGCSIIMTILSKYMITLLKWDVKSYYSLMAISIAPVCIAILSVFRGFFQGMQNMNPSGMSQIIEQLGRVFFGVGLAYLLLPKGIEYSAGGAALGAAFGGILGSIYLIIKYLSMRKEFKVKKVKNDLSILGELLYISVPISLGATVSSVMNLIDSFLVPQKLLEAGFTYKYSTILYGQLTGKASVLVNVPLSLSIALCASIVPIIAETFVLNRKKELVSKVDMAFKFSIVIALPCFLGLFFLAKPILNLIFPGHAEGYKILQYLSISIPFIIIAQTTTAILQGTGKYLLPVFNLLVGCMIKVVITLILTPIPHINVYGAVIGTIIGYVVASILNIMLLKRTLKVKINYYEVMIKPAYASILMIIAVVFIYTNVYNYTVRNSIACIVSILCGVLIYGALIILFRVLKYDYLKEKFIRKPKERK